MLDMINTEVTKILMTVQIRSEAELQKVEEPEAPKNVQYHHADYEQALAEADADAGGKTGGRAAVRAAGAEGGSQRSVSVAQARNTSTATAS